MRWRELLRKVADCVALAATTERRDHVYQNVF